MRRFVLTVAGLAVAALLFYLMIAGGGGNLPGAQLCYGC